MTIVKLFYGGANFSSDTASCFRLLWIQGRNQQLRRLLLVKNSQVVSESHLLVAQEVQEMEQYFNGWRAEGS